MAGFLADLLVAVFDAVVPERVSNIIVGLLMLVAASIALATLGAFVTSGRDKTS